MNTNPNGTDEYDEERPPRCDGCLTEGEFPQADGERLCPKCDAELTAEALAKHVTFQRPRLCADCGVPLKDTLADVCTWCLSISEGVEFYADDPYPSTALGRP